MFGLGRWQREITEATLCCHDRVSVWYSAAAPEGRLAAAAPRYRHIPRRCSRQQLERAAAARAFQLTDTARRRRCRSRHDSDPLG